MTKEKGEGVAVVAHGNTLKSVTLLSGFFFDSNSGQCTFSSSLQQY
jgi:hypothetical protein